MLAVVGCNGRKGETSSKPDDIVEQYQQVLKVADVSPDSAMHMIDSLKSKALL